MESFENPTIQNTEEDNTYYSDYQTVEDYWWIDESEVCPTLVVPDEFFNQCLAVFTEYTKSQGLITDFQPLPNDMASYGQQIVAALLNERYTIHYKTDNPEIYYSSSIELSLQSGILLAHCLKTNPRELDECILELMDMYSPMKIEALYGKELSWKNRMDETHFEGSLNTEWYELIKWYWGKDDFEACLQKSMEAVF